MFSLVRILPSPASAEDDSSLFGWFIGVGSEVARLRAGHRPPLKRSVQFSRAPLSRRCAPARSQRWYQSHQVHKPVLSVQNGHRQLLPAVVPPAAEAMRPDPAHNPTVKSVEELSDVGPLVVMAPPSQYQVQFLNQLLGRQRYASLGKLAHLIHEAVDRFLSGICIQCPRPDTTADLVGWQPELPLSALDLVP